MHTITRASIRYFSDNRMYQAEVSWSDGSSTVATIKHKNSCFLMRPSSFDLGTHMAALFARAERDGLKPTTRRGEFTLA